MQKEYSSEELSILKNELRIGNTFGLLFGCAGLLFFIIYFLFFLNDYGLQTGIIVSSALFLLTIILPPLINRDTNKDIRENKKTLFFCVIEKKFEELSYEAGSGNLYIPGLGDMFPKLWGQKMRESTKYILKVKHLKHEVGKEFFDKVNAGDEIVIHLAGNSGTILGYSKSENESSYWLNKL